MSIKTIILSHDSLQNERRVALVPAAIKTLTKKGFTVNVEENAGVQAKFLNDEYAEAGANVKAKKAVYDSDIILKVLALFIVEEICL